MSTRSRVPIPLLPHTHNSREHTPHHSAQICGSSARAHVNCVCGGHSRNHSDTTSTPSLRVGRARNPTYQQPVEAPVRKVHTAPIPPRPAHSRAITPPELAHAAKSAYNASPRKHDCVNFVTSLRYHVNRHATEKIARLGDVLHGQPCYYVARFVKRRSTCQSPSA